MVGLGFAIYLFSGLQDLTHALIIFGFVLIMFALAFARLYALKAQDRAIRAEESLRYFILTSKMLPSALKIGQIIALRFASEDEFIALVDKTIAENLSSNEIKTAIKSWKADYNRL